jgi:hypothetical protein
VPAVSARQGPEAAAVLMQRAAVVGSALEFVEAPFEQAEIGLQGIHQRENAAVAVAALRAALRFLAKRLRGDCAKSIGPGVFRWSTNKS